MNSFSPQASRVSSSSWMPPYLILTKSMIQWFNKLFLPTGITGIKEFVDASLAFAYGKDSPAIKGEWVCVCARARILPPSRVGCGHDNSFACLMWLFAVCQCISCIMCIHTRIRVNMYIYINMFLHTCTHLQRCKSLPFAFCKDFPASKSECGTWLIHVL